MVGDCTEIGFYKDMLEEDNNIRSFRMKFSSKWRLKVWIIRRVYTSAAYTYTRCPLCNSLQIAFRVDHRRVDDSYFKLYFLENEASNEQIVFFFLQFIFVSRIEPLPYHTICSQTDRLRTACPIQLKNLKYLEKYEQQEKKFHTKIVRYQGCGIFYRCLSDLAMALLRLTKIILDSSNTNSHLLSHNPVAETIPRYYKLVSFLSPAIQIWTFKRPCF